MSSNFITTIVVHFVKRHCTEEWDRPNSPSHTHHHCNYCSCIVCLIKSKESLKKACAIPSKKTNTAFAASVRRRRARAGAHLHEEGELVEEGQPTILQCLPSLPLPSLVSLHRTMTRLFYPRMTREDWPFT